MKWVFWGSTGLIAYTYVGYACWLRLRMLWRSHPVLRGSNTPTVSILMVVRNEEQVLEAKLQNLLSLDYPADRCQVIVVSDGSTDRTDEILHEYGRDPRLHVILNPLARGKASGLNDAVELASGEIVMFTDARQKIEPRALRLLAENFADPEVGCASGELMLGDPATGEASMGTGVYWRLEKRVRQLESASGSVVGATGAIYCARRNLFDALPAATILDDVLIPMQIVSKGARVILDCRARAWDSPDLGQKREFMRKVRTLNGNYQLLQLAPWVLTAKNPIRFEFVSHKLLRLAVPFALLALLASSFFSPQPFYRAALATQIVFYGLSLADVAKLKIGPLSRLADAARTFLVLNSAAVVAFAKFVTGRKITWIR